jgi:DNA invertase Pin-like site-specific DNA recombinase
MRRRNSAQPAAGTRIRCAIYTRKSTEEGLDQDFNSLDAQHEACAAYITSQRHEGWTLLPDRYDDGGFSGGNMERPSFRRLLAEVKAGRVDVIVVYKVDRLTRSLADFAKIVEVLDGAGASFVSVTQAFNTTTSMGRLTLNVLLSFAQFEREVTSERIRDKIAASKKKGIWMGGRVPLGYDVCDRKLVINEPEAETVRHIMRRYLSLGSVRALMEDLKASGIRTKPQRLGDGGVRGGVPFARGPLYHFLRNRLYIGEIPHHDQSYPGEHQAIVDRALFDEVQALLANNAVVQNSGGGAAHPSLLAGMIRDAEGRPLSPSHASKPSRSVQGGRQRYRYYVSNEATPTETAARVMRLRATELERAVVQAVSLTLDQAQPVQERWTLLDGHRAQYAERRCAALAARMRTAPDEARPLLQRLDLQIIVEEERIIASCSLRQFLLIADIPEDDIDPDARMPIIIPTQVRRRGQELRLRFEMSGERPAKRDPQLIALIVRAHDARRELAALGAGSSKDQRRELGRLARLSYLAPDIVSAVLEGRQPEPLTARQLIRNSGLPLGWNEQRQQLGFG